ncbi:hypothetical protein PJP10_13040, partial [Mycobacterium kansasii]
VPDRRTAQPNCRAPQRAPPSRIVARHSPIAALLNGPHRPGSSHGAAQLPRSSTGPTVPDRRTA